jgi:hypothetical protein
LHQLLTKGLQTTATLWQPLQNAYRFLDQAKAILANPEQDPGQHVRERYPGYCQLDAVMSLL